MVKLNPVEANTRNTVPYSALNITALNVTFSLTDDKSDLRFSVKLESDNLNFQAERTDKSSTTLPNFILAFVITVSATLQLAAVLRIFNRVMTGAESA